MQQCRGQSSCLTIESLMVIGPELFSTALFQSSDSSELQHLPHSPTHTYVHTLMAEVQGAELLIRSNLGCSILLKDTLTCSWGSQGMEPATYRLLDSLLYHLSHSNPYVMVTLCHKLLILILSKLLCLNYNLMAFEAHTDKC